jgi:pimeloyl-ACP methyl ester carboxylesterase
MRSSHSIRAVHMALALATAATAAAQIVPVAPALPETNVTNFTLFLRAQPIGTEQIALNRIADGWMISSTGRLSPPLDAVARRMQVRYTADWRPLEFQFDGIVRGQTQSLRTVVDGTTATSSVSVGGSPPQQKHDTIDPNSVLLLTNSFFSSFEAVAARVRGAAAGTEIPAYGEASLSAFKIRVGESFAEHIQTTSRMVPARRTHFAMQFSGNTAVDADIWLDETGRMIRLSLPAQSLEVVREDIAAVSSRTITISRPNDESIKIPGNGFVLAGTVSKPASQSVPRLPAVVLVGGSGPADRDSLAFGVPILGEIAGALADAGFLVVRYDKRGIGQSGGRAEAASLADYAEDVRAAVKALADRKDVDPKRLAVVGHGEGGLVALMAAAKEKKIDAAVLVATPGMAGSEIILAQQQRLLNRMSLSPEERQAKVDEQKRIFQAAITGKGLDQLPAAVRRSVDSAEFQSLLVSDPAKILKDVHQPLLVVQGELDTQVEPQNAELLVTLAKQRKKGGPVEIVKVPGVNHLLVTAKTGESDEYGTLPDKHVGAAVTQPIVTWLQKTLSAAR